MRERKEEKVYATVKVQQSTLDALKSSARLNMEYGDTLDGALRRLLHLDVKR